MTDHELHDILNHIDAALNVFGKNDVKLSAFEISIKSMLIVVRGRVMDQIQLKRFGSAERVALD